MALREAGERNKLIAEALRNLAAEIESQPCEAFGLDAIVQLANARSIRIYRYLTDFNHCDQIGVLELVKAGHVARVLAAESVTPL